MAFFCLLIATGCRAEVQPWPLWEAYTKRFMDDQGRVIDRTAGDRTTSEGQSYAMFFALVDNDHARFNKLLSWTEANLAQGDLTEHLPAWSWGRQSDGSWRTIDDNSAADADLWLAYTLIEAGRLWREPRFDVLGRAVAARIAREEVVLVPAVGTTVAPGPHGFHPEEQSWILNPSYLPLPVLAGLRRDLPGGPWGAVVASLPNVLSAENSHGFAMDWIAAGTTGLHAVAAPAEPTAGVHEAHPAGSYDAIRVYLWLGMTDPATPGAKDLLRGVPGMAAYLRGAGAPPLEVSETGATIHADSPPGFSAAVIPYLFAYGMKAEAKTQMARLSASQDTANGLYGRNADYYDQNLALFSTGFLEHRFEFGREGELHVKWK